MRFSRLHLLKITSTAGTTSPTLSTLSHRAHTICVTHIDRYKDKLTLMQLRKTREAGSPDPAAMTIPGLSINFTCLSNCTSCNDLREREGGGREGGRERGEGEGGRGERGKGEGEGEGGRGERGKGEGEGEGGGRVRGRRGCAIILLGDTRCGSYAAGFGSLQAVDDTAFTHIGEACHVIVM